MFACAGHMHVFSFFLFCYKWIHNLKVEVDSYMGYYSSKTFYWFRRISVLPERFRREKKKWLVHFLSQKTLALNNNIFFHCYPKCEWRKNQLLIESYITSRISFFWVSCEQINSASWVVLTSNKIIMTLEYMFMTLCKIVVAYYK